MHFCSRSWPPRRRSSFSRPKARAPDSRPRRLPPQPGGAGSSDRAPSRRHRPAVRRRPQDAVARSARAARGRDRGHATGASVDGRGARVAEAPRLEACTARRQDPPRLQLCPGAQRLLGADRLERDPHRRARRRRRRRLSRPRRVSGGSVGEGPRAQRLRAALRPPARRVCPRRRRTRRHDRAPRHGRRLRRSVPSRPDPGGDRQSSAEIPARSPPRSRTTRHRSSGTAPRWPGSSSAAAARPASPASRPAPRSCRSASPAGKPDAFAQWAIYGRTDQLIAGLDRAVDPNDDGDAHDAARVALVALAEPFAGFTDSPEARAAAGALALDTLVVTAAGNDGRAGAGYGDIAGPGGAPAALTVGAVDTRAETDTRAHRRPRGTGDAARRLGAGRRCPSARRTGST